ncbi:MULTISPECIES: metallophosphoesterase family protein [unclassified Spirosoma]|uniref:metallophosphoesterase family protein n=1 Tax=unclassified Spirosoma TaxID=2621999 RepID=UPI00096856F1|nr:MULTISPECIES: metallophosphoesterase family protein [unclassified Spirosoma]MBN8823673.1 metallophosphoesterase family protein [Spirosoma sp.]OJW76776.1 MAG: YfcE family phosphodiesterase [Spirosoma sp. 48-14]
MTRIGLLSDTHSYLDPQIFTHFADCDEIWHAGDVGILTVAQELRDFRPLRIVSGNIDQESVDLPANQRFTLEGLNIWITHIGGAPPKYNPLVRPQLLANPPDIFVCGHSHILKVARDPTMNKLLYINPGAAGKTGFHTMRTAVRFTLNARQIQDMQVIELGKK